MVGGFWLFLAFAQAVAVGLFSGYVAEQKGRDYWSWFALGAIFSFLALLALIALPKVEAAPVRQFFVSPPPTKEPPLPATSETKLLFNGPRDLDAPTYQLFLTRRFSIERNNTLEKFVIGDLVFESLPEALAYADSSYGEQLIAEKAQSTQSEQAAAKAAIQKANTEQRQLAVERMLDSDRRAVNQLREKEGIKKQKEIRATIIGLVALLAFIGIILLFKKSG